MQYRKDHPTWPEDLVQPMCESKKQLDATILDVLRPRMHAQEWDWRTTLQDVTQPMMLFAASPELGGIVTPEVVDRVRELNPNVTIVTVSDVGHLIRFDKFAVFMAALQAFLKRLPA